MKNSYGIPYEFIKMLKKHMVSPILFSKINTKKVAFLFQNIPKNSGNVSRYPPPWNFEKKNDLRGVSRGKGVDNKTVKYYKDGLQAQT